MIARAPQYGRSATLSALLARSVARAGSRVAIRDGEHCLTWAVFARRVEGFAHYLADRGVVPGTPVALWLPNGIDYLTGIFALARLAAPAVHINTRFGSAEIGDVLARSGARLLITRHAFGAIDLRPVLEGIDLGALPALETILFADAVPDGNLAVRCEPIPAQLDGRIEDRARADAPALVYTSSGTTARPKLIVHNQASIAGHADDVADRIGMGVEGARLLATVPFCGTFGNVAAMAAVAGAAELVCLDIFDPDRAAALIRDRRITHLFGDDRMIGRLADAAHGAPFDSVRFSAIAAFQSDAIHSIARGIAMGLHPHSIYGSSEMQALYALAPQVAGEQVAVAPVSADADVRAVDGELLLRGPSAFDHYLGEAERTQRVRDADGFFHSGDHGDVADGRFIFRSRIDDVLRLGGFLVNPREIEEFLQALPGVEGAQVVAVTHEGRAVPFAFLIAAPGATLIEADILAACRASLARYKIPVRALVIDNWPSITSPNGVKIQRGRLREMAQRHLDGPSAANDVQAHGLIHKAEIA